MLVDIFKTMKSSLCTCSLNVMFRVDQEGLLRVCAPSSSMPSACLTVSVTVIVPSQYFLWRHSVAVKVDRAAVVNVTASTVSSASPEMDEVPIYASDRGRVFRPHDHEVGQA